MRALDVLVLVLIALLFLTSLVFGMLYPMSIEVIEEQVSTLVGAVGESRDPVSRLLGLLGVILYNNIGVSLRCVVLGFTLLYPIYVIYANGYILGSVVTLIGYGSITLLPHGVLELPAILYSCYLGIRIGVLTFLAVAYKLLGKPTTTPLLYEYIVSIYKMTIVIVLLVVAAFVEVFVSLPVGEMIS